MANTASPPDRYNLDRFLQAQMGSYDHALAEIRGGRKLSHWMWFIFPQIAGLGSSSMAQRYAITCAEEAAAYLAHPVLGPRLIQCFEATLGVNGRTAYQIFGAIDEMKLRSCATLFASLSPNCSAFSLLLDKYFDSQRDPETIRLLGAAPAI